MALKKIEDKPVVTEEQVENSSPSTEEVEKEKIEIDLTETEKEVQDRVNQKRAEYQENFKKAKKLNNITTVALLAVMVAGFVLMMIQTLPSYFLYIGIGILVIALIASFIISRQVKNNVSAKAQEYIDQFYLNTNSFIFGEYVEEINSLKTQYATQKFVDAHFYNDIRQSKSRNYIELTYKGEKIEAADLAGNVLEKGRTSPMFLGKFYSYKANYNKEGQVILFQLKGENLSKPINNIENIKLQENNDTFVIYSNDDDYGKVLTNEVLRVLKSFEIDETLIDVILSIKDNQVFLGIDYSDDYMNIPVESDFKMKYAIRTKKDFEKVIKIFDLLNR
ncbi:MAG: hypothetical protein IJ656_02105 [Bacilli bacterium]|nr:hypothetical protein [Bacilli bacterium]